MEVRSSRRMRTSGAPKWPSQVCPLMRSHAADIHDGPEPNTLQSKAGYIDARPLTATAANSLATHGRTIHWGHDGRSGDTIDVFACRPKADMLPHAPETQATLVPLREAAGCREIAASYAPAASRASRSPPSPQDARWRHDRLIARRVPRAVHQKLQQRLKARCDRFQLRRLGTDQASLAGHRSSVSLPRPSPNGVKSVGDSFRLCRVHRDVPSRLPSLSLGLKGATMASVSEGVASWCRVPIARHKPRNQGDLASRPVRVSPPVRRSGVRTHTIPIRFNSWTAAITASMSARAEAVCSSPRSALFRVAR